MTSPSRPFLDQMASFSSMLGFSLAGVVTTLALGLWQEVRSQGTPLSEAIRMESVWQFPIGWVVGSFLTMLVAKLIVRFRRRESVGNAAANRTGH